MPDAFSSARAAPAGSAWRAAPSSCSCSAPRRPARLRDRGREDHERRDLGHERLGRGDRDLGPGLEEEDPVRLAGDRAADRVRDRDDGRTALAREAGRGDGVGRLAGLGHGDDQGPAVDRRRVVAELRPDRRPGRDPDPVLDRRCPDQRRVVGRAAGDQLDPVDLPDRVLEPLELLEPDVVRAGHPTGDGLAQRLGLLVDLLEHEVVVAALLGGLGRPVDGGDRRAGPRCRRYP